MLTSSGGSLEASLEYDGNLHGLVADSPVPDPQPLAEMAEPRARLLESIKALGEQERAATAFYFSTRASF